MRIVGGPLACCVVLATGQAALAVPMQVTSRAALGGNLDIPWTSFGPVGTSVNVYQQQTVGSELVHVNSSAGTVFIKQQGNGFSGDFPNNTVVLTQPNPDDGLTIGFVPPVLGVGFDIGPVGYGGAYTAYLQTFDAASKSIGVISATGNATTPTFLGETSVDDPISFFVLGLVEPGNGAVPQFNLNGMPVLGNIALDTVSVIVPVPEPSAAFLLLSAMTILVSHRVRKR